jgi:hypothetical protein
MIFAKVTGTVVSFGLLGLVGPDVTAQQKIAPTIERCLTTTASAYARPGEVSTSRRREVQYERVMTYLRRAGLLQFVDRTITSHGSGASFHVTFPFRDDEASRAEVLAILRNTKVFEEGPLGDGHVKAVRASERSEAADFRSFNGALGYWSLEVMINRKTFLGYADIDRFDIYGGLAPAAGHVFLELFPHKIIDIMRGHESRDTRSEQFVLVVGGGEADRSSCDVH